MVVTTRTAHSLPRLVLARTPASRIWSNNPLIDVALSLPVGVAVGGYAPDGYRPEASVALGLALVAFLLSLGWFICLVVLPGLRGARLAAFARGFPSTFVTRLSLIAGQGLALAAAVGGVAAATFVGRASVTFAVTASIVVMLGCLRCSIMTSTVLAVNLRRPE